MTKVDRLIRQLPVAFLVVALADFVRQLASVASYWNEVRYFSLAGEQANIFWKVVFDLIDRSFGLIIYPLAWIGSAATIHLLLKIYDQGRATNA